MLVPVSRGTLVQGEGGRVSQPLPWDNFDLPSHDMMITMMTIGKDHYNGAQVHIVCSNCSEEQMSPLHRGINISSSSIGSQEVNLDCDKMENLDCDKMEKISILTSLSVRNDLSKHFLCS